MVFDIAGLDYDDISHYLAASLHDHQQTRPYIGEIVLVLFKDVRIEKRVNLFVLQSRIPHSP